jgi:hypothetical protein
MEAVAAAADFAEAEAKEKEKLLRRRRGLGRSAVVRMGAAPGIALSSRIWRKLWSRGFYENKRASAASVGYARVKRVSRIKCRPI